MKKGQTMSLNVVVVAALLLLVVVVLMLVFSGKLSFFQKTVAGCEITGGTCKSTCGQGFTLVPGQTCPNNQECCIEIKGCEVNGGSCQSSCGTGYTSIQGDCGSGRVCCQRA